MKSCRKINFAAALLFMNKYVKLIKLIHLQFPLEGRQEVYLRQL